MNRERTTIRPRVGRAIAALGVAVGLALPALANAQVTFAGGTQFRFNGAGVFTNAATVGGFTLTGTGGSILGGANTNSFSVVLSGPGDTKHIGPTGTGNLGTGSLVYTGAVCTTGRNNNASTCGFNYTGMTVEMLVNFSSPNTPNQTFAGIIGGRVTNTTQGIQIDWDTTNLPNLGDNGIVGLWSDLTSNGTYALTLTDPYTVKVNGSSDVGGDITLETQVTATPEPASMLLVGSGLLGVFAVGRRRRTKA